jgi:O-acetyl-ADP-ribose deacetylase (regulator of RNase III)
MTETDATSKLTGGPPRLPHPQPPRATVRGMRHLATALAVLALGACGAGSFGLGSSAAAGAGTHAVTAGPGPSIGGGDDRGIDPEDPITSGTDRANAATPNNAGRARTYPQGEFSDEQINSYGHAELPRGDGYYISIHKRWAILAGYTVEQATQRAKLTGFSGTIRVTEGDRFDPSCADGVVCAVFPAYWQGSSEQLILFVNRHMKISSPD